MLSKRNDLSPSDLLSIMNLLPFMPTEYTVIVTFIADEKWF